MHTCDAVLYQVDRFLLLISSELCSALSKSGWTAFTLKGWCGHAATSQRGLIMLNSTATRSLVDSRGCWDPISQS